MSIYDHSMTFGGTGSQSFQAVGRYLRIREADSDVYLTVDSGRELKRARGEQIDLGREGVKVVVRSLIAQTVVLIVSQNRQDDNRQAVDVAVSATVVGGNDNQHLPVVVIAAGASALIAAANSDRKTLRVSLPSSAAGFITIGKSGVAAATGGLLEPGITDYIDTQGALYGFNNNAVSVSVYSMEVNDL